MTTDLENKLFQTEASAQWKRVGVKHHHGMALPLFSLHSNQSAGIGEFTDLHLLIEFCKKVGMDVVQLLPLNDTGQDQSPYNAISACALNPIHLGLRKLPQVEKVPQMEERLNRLSSWNRNERVPYSIVRELKNLFLRDYFEAAGKEIISSENFKNFQNSHPWLSSYSLFKVLKEAQGWISWEDWPSNLKSPSDATFESLLKEHEPARLFHEVVQYYCFQQLEEVKKAAEASNIRIKGDIPILLSRDSCDVWRYRSNFLLHLAAGAPPDMLGPDGQYWGFPVYDWEAIEKEGYRFWKMRLKAAESLYDLYRLDHAVGFFRIFAISLGKPAKEGFFMPEKPETWIPHGKKIMDVLLKSSKMLPIAEDLGTVPPEVRVALQELGILGTKVMRWERRWNTDGKFIPYNEYIPESMTTVSTHDSDTLQLWWRHSPKEARLFSEFKGWDYRPFLSLDRQKEILKDSHHTTSLFHINLLQEYLALFPELVSPNLQEERINVPGKVTDTNWTYKFRPSLDELLNHNALQGAIREVIS